MFTPRIAYDVDVMWSYTPYNPNFVSELKAQIPASGRRWNADRKLWVIDLRYKPELERLLWYFWQEYEVVPLLYIYDIGVRGQRVTPTGTYSNASGAGQSTGQQSTGNGQGSSQGSSQNSRGTWNAYRDQYVEAYTTLHLLPDAPVELIKAAYRCLAKLNHPDRGGDEKAMQRINEAYAVLERGVILAS